MRVATTVPLTSLLAADLSLSQFIPTPKDLITTNGPLNLNIRSKRIPAALCNLPPDVKSYSGYVSTDPTTNIFWWFFEAVDASKNGTTPLTVFTSGGPGDATSSAALSANGPCFAGDNNERNPYAWNTGTNLLYIDQPVQTGFSYSRARRGYKDGDEVSWLDDNEQCPEGAQECGTYNYQDTDTTANSTLNAAPVFWRTLQGFLSAFPQYAGPLYMATESYGGHYGPIFVDYMLKANGWIDKGDPDVKGARKLEVKGLIVGNGWFNPLIQFPAYYTFETSPGGAQQKLSSSNAAQMHENVFKLGGCLDLLQDCQKNGSNTVCKDADDKCISNVQSFPDSHKTKRDNKNSLGTDLTSEDFIEGLGASVNFTQSSSAVGQAFENTGDDARELGIMGIMESLAQRGVYVLMYVGDTDYVCNWFGVEAVAAGMNIPGFSKSEYEDVLMPGHGTTPGQVKQSNGFAVVRVYGAGHIARTDSPELALTMLQRVLQRKDIATGMKDLGQISGQGSEKSAGSGVSGRQGMMGFSWTPLLVLGIFGFVI